jgi:hypothetical protein
VHFFFAVVCSGHKKILLPCSSTMICFRCPKERWTRRNKRLQWEGGKCYYFTGWFRDNSRTKQGHRGVTVRESVKVTCKPFGTWGAYIYAFPPHPSKTDSHPRAPPRLPDGGPNSPPRPAPHRTPGEEIRPSSGELPCPPAGAFHFSAEVQ